MKNYLGALKKLNDVSLIALTLLFLPSAIAGNLTGPDSSTDGNYTISSTGNFCNESLLSYQLRENNVSIQSACSISMSFSNKPTGVYNYALLECEYDPDVNYNFCVQIDSHAVTVSRADGVNPNGDIEVRLGDYNSDGLSDIFVKSSITAPYILKQTAYNSFQLITGLTTTQINNYSNWGLATQILAYVSDLNIDGTDDMMLVGISSHIPAAADQMIHSQYNGSANTAPTSATGMTTSTKRFLLETLGLSQDRAYLVRTMVDNGAYSLISHGYTYAFFNTAYLQLFQMGINGSTYVGFEENPYDDSTQPNSCAFYSCYFDSIGGQWQMYVYAEVIDITWDYSIFHPSTVNLDQEIIKVEDGNSTLDNLLDIFESHLGYVSCNGIADDQVDVFDNVHSFNYFRINTCTFALLARFINGFSYKELREIGDDKMQFRASKVGDEWWAPYYHASISNVEKLAWFSGFPTDNGLNLEGHFRKPDDNPHNNLLVGIIISPLSYSDTVAQLFLAKGRYDNGLEYTIFPAADNTGYNSNSFAKGLVDIVGYTKEISHFNTQGMADVVDIPINESKFPGLDKPVPKSEFGM